MSAQNWFDLVQTIVMVGGIVFAVRQLQLTAKQIGLAAEATKAAALQTELSAKTSHAAALSSIATEGSEILWKVIQDPSLHRLFDENIPATGFGPEDKLALVRGMLIRHFANSFHLKQLGHIDDNLWTAHKADMATFFRNKQTEKRWETLKKYYDPEFRKFVDKELLNLT
jgi:hypothetical protein